MPRFTLVLIIVGLLVGTWSTVRPHFGSKPQVKGTTISKNNLSLPTLTPLPTKAPNFTNPNIEARNVAVVDIDSGYILYEKDVYKTVPIASLTKVMTAMLILEENKLDDVIEISKEAAFANGSTILLRPQEKMTIENLLKGLLIQSGNDAATALAQHNAGSIEKFVEKMNLKAKLLGLNNTKFKDPAGLDDEGIASPREMAFVMAYALRHEKFKEIIRTPETIIYSADNAFSHKLENSNRLVKEEMFFPGIIGGKTGFTPTAGHNMVAAASRDGHTLVVVILNTHSPQKEASAIEASKALDWAFTNHVWLTTNQETNN